LITALRMPGKKHFYNLALRVALLIRDSLNVRVYGDLQSSVTAEAP
jgi:Arc/MetJ family transcription regulator